MTFKAAILSNTYSVNFIPDTVLLCLNLPHLHRFCAIVMYQNFMLDLYIFFQLNLSNLNASYIRDTTGKGF